MYVIPVALRHMASERYEAQELFRKILYILTDNHGLSPAILPGNVAVAGDRDTAADLCLLLMFEAQTVSVMWGPHMWGTCGGTPILESADGYSRVRTWTRRLPRFGCPDAQGPEVSDEGAFATGATCPNAGHLCESRRPSDGKIRRHKLRSVVLVRHEIDRGQRAGTDLENEILWVIPPIPLAIRDVRCRAYNRGRVCGDLE